MKKHSKAATIMGGLSVLSGICLFVAASFSIGIWAYVLAMSVIAFHELAKWAE